MLLVALLWLWRTLWRMTIVGRYTSYKRISRRIKPEKLFDINFSMESLWILFKCSNEQRNRVHVSKSWYHYWNIPKWILICYLIVSTTITRNTKPNVLFTYFCLHNDNFKFIQKLFQHKSTLQMHIRCITHRFNESTLQTCTISILLIKWPMPWPTTSCHKTL